MLYNSFQVSVCNCNWNGDGKMEGDNKKKLTVYDIQFGRVAVKQGFLTEEQLKEALYEQIKDDLTHRPHRLLGEICGLKGWMTQEQIDEVLDELQKEKKKNEEHI